jgi:large-conductance mechanosensitive channel
MVKKIKLFLMRSNIIDLATGVVIGTVFQKIFQLRLKNLYANRGRIDWWRKFERPIF